MVEIIRNWTVRSKNYFGILFKFAFQDLVDATTY